MIDTYENPEALAQASRLLELDEKWFQPFCMSDPFNDDISVTGYLSRKPDHRYGAMVIDRVDGRPAVQVIAATPKLHYPFDKVGTFRFPPVRRITFYEKLDGTNVLAFRYGDGSGVTRSSYKLRLSPFLRNSKHGSFLDLWRELLIRHPEIETAAETNDCHVSFEMYGARNSHLIEYEIPLAAAALFGVRDDWTLVPIHHLDLKDIPTARELGQLSSDQDPVARYQRLRAEMESGNRDGDDDRIVGTEGAVWYAEGHDGRVSVWKCKPESVEAIHWATGINKTAVVATCHNVLETSDILSFETLEPLLLEEYSKEEIEGFTEHIETCIDQVNKEMAFVEEVLRAYRETEMDIVSQRGNVMRALSKQFQRSIMKRVYSTIIRHLDRQ